MHHRPQSRRDVARALTVPGLAVALLVACGPSATSQSSTAATELPPTDRDPPPYVPGPTEEPRTGETVGIATSGGFEQARSLAVRFVEAVRDGDRQALEEQLAETVGRTRPRLLTPHMPRAQIVEQLVEGPRRRFAPDADTPIEQLIDANAITVTPLSQSEDAGELPEGLLPTDLDVVIPIGEVGRRFLLHMLQWAPNGRLIVRPGVQPRILAW